VSNTLDIDKLGVFQVFTGSGTGSGFLIDPHHLVTNCHVVGPYATVAVERRNKVRVVAKVRRIHPKRDLAVVQLSSPFDGALLPLASSDGLQPKQPVDIIGFPVGLPLSITEGVVSNPKQLVDGQHFVQTDAAINPGNSGGPILDEHGHIVAVTTCKLKSADMVGFGIPGSDVQRFVRAFGEQTAEFGATCPACEVLIDTPERYCNSCGSDLAEYDLATYFEASEPHPIVDFVERGLANAKIDPMLARHGAQNWSFYSGSAPIKIWCCCSEHLCFSSTLAQVGKQRLDELFRFLLSAEHAPFAFALRDNLIQLNLTFHVADVFAHARDDEMSAWIAQFVTMADRFDNLLVEKYACEPAPETQLTFFKEQQQ
jgi:serine protease Do